MSKTEKQHKTSEYKKKIKGNKHLKDPFLVSALTVPTLPKKHGRVEESILLSTFRC